MGKAIGILGQGATAQSSSQLSMSIPGTLAIGSNLGPAAFYGATTTVRTATAMVKSAPVGSSLVFAVYAGTSPPTLLYTITITSGNVLGTAAGTVNVPANTQVVVNITSVGSPTFPGADATVQLN
jgi:hypothetical protein